MTFTKDSSEYVVNAVGGVLGEYELIDNGKVFGKVYTGEEEYIWGLPIGTLEDAFPKLEEAVDACIEWYEAWLGEDL